MSDLVMVDASDALERAADPGEFVVLALERGKSWLAEALAHGNLDALVEVKGWAATLRTATVQKQLGKDAQLSAEELVRRAERCIGLGIRQGQNEGMIAKRGSNLDRTAVHAVRSPLEFATQGELSGDRSGGVGIYSLADDVTDGQFDEAIKEARAEQNLSRANVARKVKQPSDSGAVSARIAEARKLAAGGHTIEQIAKRIGYARAGAVDFLKRHGIEVPAEAVVRGTRRVDSNRILRETAYALEGIVSGVALIEVSALDQDALPELVASLRESLQALNRLVKEISK